jgi:hypothetical protein
MRTPTGDYMTCAGGHAASDLHGAGFGASGWFSWSGEPDVTSPAIAEQHRIERIVAGLRNGESTVINGTPVTAVSLAEAQAVIRYENASHRTAELSTLMDSRDLTPAEFDALEFAQDTMRQARATLAAAGRLDLIGAA